MGPTYTATSSLRTPTDAKCIKRCFLSSNPPEAGSRSTGNHKETPLFFFEENTFTVCSKTLFECEWLISLSANPEQGMNLLFFSYFT